MSNVATASASEVTIQGLAELQSKEAQLKELKRAVKAKKDAQKWEEETKAKNPQYVMGSLREPTEDDLESLTHCHGMVCEIECAVCGAIRVVNKQDAKQCKYCVDHKKEAQKAKSKAKRLEKALNGKSVEDVQAEIEKLQEELGNLD